jgi:hypothetical protein
VQISLQVLIKKSKECSIGVSIYTENMLQSETPTARCTDLSANKSMPGLESNLETLGSAIIISEICSIA